MHRFTDTESTPTQLTPVYGYLTHQLLPLPKALEPISSQIEQLDRFSKIAKTTCLFPSEHGLTRDESAAVFLYTMECGENSFYKVINRALRAEDRSSLKPWFAYLKLFDTAVQKLPTIRKNLWRGVARDISKNYKKGDEFTWWTISSCSSSVNVIEHFLEPNSTLFLIEAVNGKDVSGYTNYPSEDEVILCPGTRLRVVSDPLDQPPMHVVHLQEVTDDTEEQITAGLQTMTVTSSSKTKSNHTTMDTQSLPVHSHTDANGNRYEGEMKNGKKHGKGSMDYASGSKYIGIWVNDKRTGYGVYTSSVGDRYEGQFKDNKKHGKGTYIWAPNADGISDKYVGDWMDDVRTGQGVYTYANGNRYEGQFKDKKRHGKGTQVWAPNADGISDKYVGDWMDDVRTGQGVYTYAFGDRYEGQLKDNKNHGKGTYVWGPNTQWAGDKYTGDWMDDVITGQGVYTYANGNRYEGQFKDKKRHGKGTKVWAPNADGISDKYVGDWMDDVRTGQGVYTYANGDRYEGQWKDNKRHGKGTKVWAPNADEISKKYVGDWMDDLITGQGVYTYPNGNRYEGQWKDSKRHGEGKMTYTNGTVKDGMWSDDKFIG